MSIFNGDLSELESLTLQPLFYTLSGIEDLCFHTQERQFSLQEIQKMVEINQLNFHGFILPEKIKQRFIL